MIFKRGKENGIYILQSIDHGPFELGTTKDTLGTTSEEGVLLGPKMHHTYNDLNDNEKKQFDANVRATNIMLQGLPKDIYKLINHNIKAKAIWDNVKMLLARYELTKEDKESQLYDEFECFKILLSENINEYYVRFYKLVNDMRNIMMTMPNLKLNSKFVNNMSPEWDRADIIRIRGTLLGEMVQLAMREHKLELGMSMQNSNYFKDKMLLMQAQENGEVLDEEELLFLTGEQTNNFDIDVDDHPVRDLALNDDNIFQADECDAFDSDVNDEPTAQSIFMANLSSAGPTNQQAGPSNVSILFEVHDLENAIDPCNDNHNEHEIHNEVQHKNIIDSTRDHMGYSNVTPYKQYLSINDFSVVPSCASFVSNDAYVLHDNDAYISHDPLVTELNIYKEQVAIYEQRAKSDNSKLLEKIKNDDHDTMVKDFSKLEVAHLNLHLKHQHLKENIENIKSKSFKDVPEFDVFFEHIKRDDQIQAHKNTICKLKAQISQLKANISDDTRKLDYKSLDSQNIQLKETVTALQERLRNFKAENEKVKLHYQELFNSIKITSVQTIDKTTSLQNKIENLKTQLKGKMPCVTSNDATPMVPACAKYAIDVHPIPPRQRNNRVAYHCYLKRLRDTLDTLYERVEKATRVSNATKARRSQPKSNTMHDKTSPANSVPEKKVEDHHRKNKSKLSKKNRVDSSTSVRRTVLDTNSNSLCKTCNECISFVNHDK
nr:putative zinc finger, CCHC-type [Tanacetum cinerariifolium]